LSALAPPSRPGLWFWLPGTHTPRRFCSIWLCMYVFSQFARFAARTARCTSCLLRRDGRLVHMLPHLFDPQKCVCVVCFGWFWCQFGSSAPSLHFYRSAFSWEYQHKFRSNRFPFILILMPCIVHIVKTLPDCNWLLSNWCRVGKLGCPGSTSGTLSCGCAKCDWRCSSPWLSRNKRNVRPFVRSHQLVHLWAASVIEFDHLVCLLYFNCFFLSLR
jgi:hypothetical protein